MCPDLVYYIDIYEIGDKIYIDIFHVDGARSLRALSRRCVRAQAAFDRETDDEKVSY